MKNLAVYNSYCMRAAAGLAVASVVAVFLYGAFLLMAVSHTARLSQAEEGIRTIQGAMSSLESEYLTRSATLTLARAQSLGFVEPTEEWVVYAAPAVLTVNR